MALPTTRRSGLGGTCAIGALYAGADIQGWQLTVNQGVLDANAKSDTAEVKQIGRKGATISINKLVAATALMKTSLLGTTHAVTLTTGSGATLGSTGDVVFTGNCVVTKLGYTSPDGMEAEDVEMVSTGAFTLKDA
jgi:hypothetical protein